MDQPQVLGTIPWNTRGRTKERREESNQAAKLPSTGGLSGQEGRTVCTGHADSPARCHGQSINATRTTKVKPGKTDCLQGLGGQSAPDPDRPLLKLGPSTNRLQQKPKKNRIKPKQDKNTKNTTTNWAKLAPRGLSARPTRTVCASRTEAKTARPRGSTPPTHHRISQTVEAEEARVWGQDMRPTRMLYPNNFTS
jgi:hypothetical protein